MALLLADRFRDGAMGVEQRPVVVTQPRGQRPNGGAGR